MKPIRSLYFGIGLAAATITQPFAASDSINVWDDGFDTSGSFAKPNSSPVNVYDASRSYGSNFGSVTNNSVTPLLSNDTVAAMQTAINKYSRIVKTGGWPKVRGNLARGANSADVINLRQRLFLEGDLPRVSGDAKVFDFNVDQAVRRFQARHGLVINGIVAADTLNAINVTAAGRLRQMKLNLTRIKKAKRKIYNKAIVVNIPAQKVETVENGAIVSRHNIVIGKIDRQTPLISSTLSQVNFNPYWHVPVSIVRRDLVPKIISDPSYIKRTGMRIYTTWGGTEIDPKDIDFRSPKALRYAYRQDPSRGNSLGQVKLNFPSPSAVFMHDTPGQSLFTRNFRAYSSGCIRIQNIRQVVDWVLKDEKGWTPSAASAYFANGERKDVNLRSKVSVRMVYITSWVTPAGTVHFRKDLYKKDGIGSLAAN
ncbi:MAG: L,D-transpeptidase family protein [Rhizobiales bacterium]|nr:L,D-transpeptidase family protein [Hyphomicrobiales bacterium]NRB15547.1 L,D-transpeptidase family protein [Hyphomicrobiales bacterium]